MHMYVLLCVYACAIVHVLYVLLCVYACAIVHVLYVLLCVYAQKSKPCPIEWLFCLPLFQKLMQLYI